MRQNKALIIEFVIGIILAGVRLGTEFDYYSTLIFATGFGLASVRIMLIVLLLLDFVLALLRAEAWVTGMVFVLFVLLWVSDVAAFRYLEKRMY